jgi:signal transduction histidine kinase
MKMKPQLQRLGSRYSTVLHRHVKKQSPQNLLKANKLGVRALKLGVGALGMAVMHERALTFMLKHEESRLKDERVIENICAFFANALLPIESNLNGKEGGELKRHVKMIVESLTIRTVQLATTKAELKKEIDHRQAIELALRGSERSSTQILEKSRRMQEDQRLLSRRILSAQEEERKTISRELHDVVAQILTGIHVRLEALAATSGADTRALNQRIKTTQRLLEKSVNKIHRFARDLRPALLDDLGLIPAMRSWMKRFTEETGVRTALTAEASIEKLDINTRTVLYRIAQEAMNNVALHARATHVKACISIERQGVHMEIADDGCGFHVDDATFIRRSKRLGLLGMRERAEMVGGRLCIDSSPGRSTSVHVRIPCDPKRNIRQSSTGSCDPDKLQCS